ncbi:cytochrome o ubiquinol oxidase subunit II, partial [Pseudomonas aeruginosa]|nr:cytochrome o ubiquinol oxidase subunit II [Pseudomonas aeruginosa]
DSKGMVGLAQRDLILICIGLMLIVVIPAIVLTFVFAWRYRAGNTKAKYTPDWSHSTKVEIVVWGVPLIIIAVLAVIVGKSTHELDPYKPLDVAGEPLHGDVIAPDREGGVGYPDRGIAPGHHLNLPAKPPLAFKHT